MKQKIYMTFVDILHAAVVVIIVSSASKSFTQTHTHSLDKSNPIDIGTDHVVLIIEMRVYS